MPRTLFALAIALLVAGTAGCRMCAHPYDYCRPTFTGECGEPCMPNARDGSILAPAWQLGAGSEIPPAEVIPVPDPMVHSMPGVEHPVDMAHAGRTRQVATRPVSQSQRR
jgi:hypothetical protein